MGEIPPTSPTPPPSSSPEPTDTSGSSSNTSGSSSQETSSSKKEEESSQKESELVNFFLQAPYVQNNPSLAAEIEANPDKVEQGVQLYSKQSQKTKQDQQKSDEQTKQAIQAAAPPESIDNTQTSKQKGEGK